MIPAWLISKRDQTCAKCEQVATCEVAIRILEQAPPCPLGRLPALADEIAERAWPSSVQRLSGCCDPPQAVIQ